MIEFTAHLANRPGMLATLAEQIAAAGVNIEALAAFGVGEVGVVRLIVTDEATTRSVFERAGISFEARPVTVTTLPHHPGALAALARDLADSGVNIDAIYLLRSSAEGLELAIGIEDGDPPEHRYGTA